MFSNLCGEHWDQIRTSQIRKQQKEHWRLLTIFISLLRGTVLRRTSGLIISSATRPLRKYVAVRAIHLSQNSKGACKEMIIFKDSNASFCVYHFYILTCKIKFILFIGFLHNRAKARTTSEASRALQPVVLYVSALTCIHCVYLEEQFNCTR